MTRTRRTDAVVWALAWIAAALAGLALVLRQYRQILHARLGPDFAVYYEAATRIARGVSPYGVAKFVYTPVVAIAIRPLTGTDIHHAFRIWTVANLVFVAVTIALFLAATPRSEARWHGPVMLVVCAGTAAYFWPLKVSILLGQTDPLVTLVLMAAMLAGAREYAAGRGALVSVAGLIKVWPWALVVVVAQTGLRDRRRFVVGFILTALVAPLTALLWGRHGLWGLWHNAFVARSQHQVSRSLWGTADLLFTRTGFARPLVVSGTLHVLFAVVMLVWVLGVVAVALRTPGDAGVCMWTLMGCIVLLLPVCHTAYSLYLLPLVWIWVARALRGGAGRPITLGVAAVLVVWWLLMTHTWPDNGSSPDISSVRYSLDFFADLIALTASAGGAFALTRLRPTRER